MRISEVDGIQNMDGSIQVTFGACGLKSNSIEGVSDRLVCVDRK